MGELADGGGLHQSRDPLLSLAPVRQCRLDRGLARGRELGDALALVDVPNLDPNQAAAPTLPFFAPSHFSGRKGFFHSRSKISWVRFLIERETLVGGTAGKCGHAADQETPS